jgi:hypothetical protein
MIKVSCDVARGQIRALPIVQHTGSVSLVYGSIVVCVLCLLCGNIPICYWNLWGHFIRWIMQSIKESVVLSRLFEIWKWHLKILLQFHLKDKLEQSKYKAIRLVSIICSISWSCFFWYFLSVLFLIRISYCWFSFWCRHVNSKNIWLCSCM